MRISAPHESLTAASAMVAVSELVQRLGVIETLDGAVNSIKRQARGIQWGRCGRGWLPPSWPNARQRRLYFPLIRVRSWTSIRYREDPSAQVTDGVDQTRTHHRSPENRKVDGSTPPRLLHLGTQRTMHSATGTRGTSAGKLAHPARGRFTVGRVGGRCDAR